MRFFSRVALTFLLFGAAPTIVQAETPDSIPNPQKTRRSWVADSANVIDENTEQQINARITSLEKATGAEIAVVTVNNLGNLSVENFATDLFNKWGIGKKGKENGVLILAAITDRKARIEVGYELEPIITDGLTAEIQRELLLPAFRAGNYGKGLFDVTSQLATTIEKGEGEGTNSNTRGLTENGGSGTGNNPPDTKYFPDDPFSSSPDNITVPSSGNIAIGGAFILFVLLGGVGIIGFVVWLKARPKKCPNCSAEMLKVPAELEAPHLTNAQEFEQSLGGRDWVVWRCPQCETHEVEAHNKWFSGIEDCSRCGNRTAQRSSRILSYPTRYSTGVEEITHQCSFPECRHRRVERRTIPRIPPPSSSRSSGGFGGGFGGSSSSRSSGGGSFGGGRSGGGGSSSSW